MQLRNKDKDRERDTIDIDIFNFNLFKLPGTTLILEQNEKSTKIKIKHV